MNDSIPHVSVAFSNNNIQSPLDNIDGFAGFCGTGFQAGNQGKVFIIHSVVEAESYGITALTEPTAYRHIKEFYGELAASQKSYWLLLPPAVTMAQMLDSTKVEYANKLIKFAQGSIAYLGIFRTPAGGYNAGANFMDSDVSAAVTASKTFAQSLNNNLLFTRILIEGRVNAENSTNIYSPKTAMNGFAGVVLGGTLPDKSASVGLALGRKVKYECHIKIGKVVNGPLNATNIYVGSKLLGDNSLILPAVNEVRASATLTVTTAGTDNDIVSFYLSDPSGVMTWLGYYQKITADNTAAKVATAIAAAINAYTANTGYSAAVAGAVVTVTAAAGTGDTKNGGSIILDMYNTGGIPATMAVDKTNFAGGVTAKPERAFSTDELHSLGYISFVTYPLKAGYFFGIDNMASNDDYKILVHGALIDAVAKVAVDVYINDLEGEVDTNADGTIKDVDAKYLEDTVKARVTLSLGNRLSDFYPEVDRTVNIIETSRTKVKLRVLPKGYNTYIDIDLGLTSGK